MKHKSLVSIVAAALAFPVLSHGLGTRLASQDADAVARGEAFAATADNPSAVFYNPAGITQLDGVQVRMGTYAIALDVTVDLDAPGADF
jgi:long-chain fatty acid transport protein